MRYGYPNPWDAAAQGISQGISDYANIAGLQLKKEEAKQRTTLFNEAVADIAYKNQPIGTVGEIIDSTPDLDDIGKQKISNVVSRYGYKPEDQILRKHLPEVQKLLEENPNIVESVNTERLRNLRSQSALITDPIAKADLNEKIKRYELGTKHLIDVSKAKSEEKKAEAAMVAAKTKETKYPKTAEEAIAMGYPEDTIKKMQAIAVEQKMAGRTPPEHETWTPAIDNEGYPIQISNRGKIMAMPGAAEKKQKADQLKALEASVATEEAKIAAGKRDPFTEEEVETLNERSRAIDGVNRFEYKVVEKNIFSKDKTRVARKTGAAAVPNAPVITKPKQPSPDAKWDGTNWYRINPKTKKKQIWQE